MSTKRQAVGIFIYIDFIGAAHEEITKHALDHLGEYTLMLRVLGAYPRFKG